MNSLFDEPILRAPLRTMSEDEREQYILGLIDLVAMPYRRDRDNRDLDTAVNTLADAIMYACSKQMTQQENLDFRAYLRRLSKIVSVVS